MYGITGSKPTVAETEAYFEGAAAGIRLFAYHRDGVQYVGTTGTTLALALDELEAERRRALELDAPKAPEAKAEPAKAEAGKAPESKGGKKEKNGKTHS